MSASTRRSTVKATPRLPGNVMTRRAHRSDLSAITAIYNHYVQRSTATFEIAKRTPERSKAWFEELQSKGLPVLVAECSEQVVGWGSLSPYNSRCAYRGTLELSLYVDHRFVRQGIGRRLARGLLAWAGTSGYHCIVGVIASENSISLDMALDSGFRTVGVLKEVGYKFDRWLDVTIVQKLL